MRWMLDAANEEPRLHATFNQQVVRGRFLEGREGVLVDIGARDGVYTQQLLDSLEKAQGRSGLWSPVVGEINTAYLQNARKRFRCVVTNAENSDLPFKDRSVACVVLNQILEHLKDPYRVLSEADRILNVGGMLLIGVPNLGGLVNRLYLLMGRQPPAIHMPGPHVRGYTLRSLRAYLTSNPNFRLRSCFGACFYPFPPFLSERLGARFPEFSSYMFFVLEKIADQQPSVWRAAREATGETTFGD